METDVLTVDTIPLRKRSVGRPGVGPHFRPTPVTKDLALYFVSL